ncbi:hypothetical protein NZK35_20985 [Stieleria sp. ICT_E10.1]|uniref:hypothetical protein n=1 Tax=Stieleria sedimenti TaxID=2976331 RepID=UPI00217F769F|nr:hypothetical protein [Stieleria sedimenti]MCS7469135.1 hypothetical protein [Stieleria sedimenti]
MKQTHTLTDVDSMQYSPARRRRTIPRLAPETLRFAAAVIGVWFASHLTTVQRCAAAANDALFQPVPIAVVDPGTRVRDESEQVSWNRQILVASPKINSGDIDSLSGSIRDAATKCALTIMARVEKSTSQGHYELKQIGVGYSVDGPAGRIIISSDTASDLDVPLGFIARQVLKTNERQLAEVSLIAQSPALAMFDAPSVMLRNGQHRTYLTRHLVYLDPVSGEGAMVTWLLVPPTDEEHPMAIINQPMRVTKWSTNESRKIHVDANEFNFLGVPGELAFALEDLPPGIDVAWTKRAARLAGKKAFTTTELRELADALREAMEAK